MASPLLRSFRSSRGNDIDFEAGAERQGGYCDRRARGIRRRELPGIDPVDHSVVADIGQEDPNLHDISEALSRRFENGANILEYLFGLGGHATRDEFARCRVLPYLTTQIDETVALNGLRKRPNRRRELGRDDGGLCHDSFLRGLYQIV